MTKAIAFHEQQTKPEIDFPKPERRIAGNPKRTTWNHFVNDSNEVFAGEWSCEVGSWRIEFGPTEDEFFFVTKGHVRITADAGERAEARAGQSLVIPADFRGTFEVIEAMHKHYVIIERKV